MVGVEHVALDRVRFDGARRGDRRASPTCRELEAVLAERGAAALAEADGPRGPGARTPDGARAGARGPVRDGVLHGLLEALRAGAPDGAPWLWWEGLRDATRPALDRRAVAARGDFASEVLGLAGRAGGRRRARCDEALARWLRRPPRSPSPRRRSRPRSTSRSTSWPETSRDRAPSPAGRSTASARSAGMRSRDLPDGLLVVSGPNEAGKSTLLDFLRGVLFGFPDGRSRLPRHEPVGGGPHGGRVLLDVDGHGWTVERHASPRRIGLDGPGGEHGGEDELRALLGGADAELYRTVFAFGLARARRPRHAGGRRGARADLLGRRRGRRALGGQRDGAARQARGRLLTASGRSGRIRELERELKLAEGAPARGTRRVGHAMPERGRTRRRRATPSCGCARPGPARPARSGGRGGWSSCGRWRRRGPALAAELAALPADPGIDDASEARLEPRADAGVRRRGVAAGADRELDAATAAHDAVACDERWSRSRARCGRWRGSAPPTSSAQERLVGLRAACASATGTLRDELARLGPGWDRDRLEAFDASIPTAGQVRGWGDRLARAEADARQAAAADRERQSAAARRRATSTRRARGSPRPAATRASTGRRRPCARCAASCRSRPGATASAAAGGPTVRRAHGGARPWPWRCWSRSRRCWRRASDAGAAVVALVAAAAVAGWPARARATAALPASAGPRARGGRGRRPRAARGRARAQRHARRGGACLGAGRGPGPRRARPSGRRATAAEAATAAAEATRAADAAAARAGAEAAAGRRRPTGSASVPTARRLRPPTSSRASSGRAGRCAG